MVVFPHQELTARRLDIDRAKGLAILFVVFGHIVARADPLHVDWYEPMRRAVYAFHMPLFLYLSGIVAVYSGAVFTPPNDWWHLLTLRARRLLIPFFALGITIVCGKLLAKQFMFVDNAPEDLWAGLASLVGHTADSPALSIWYLFVLFTLSISAPVLVWLDRGHPDVLLIVGLLVYCAPLPAFLYLDHIGKYAIFFALGSWAAMQGKKWTEVVDRYWRILLFLLLCVLSLIVGFGARWPVKLELLPVGALSMPAFHGLVRHLPVPFAAILLWLGRNSFMIYLFNTIFIGFTKGLLLRITNWDGSHFLFFAVLLMASGTLGPILLRQMLFQRVKILDRYTR